MRNTAVVFGLIMRNIIKCWGIANDGKSQKIILEQALFNQLGAFGWRLRSTLGINGQLRTSLRAIPNGPKTSAVWDGSSPWSWKDATFGRHLSPAAIHFLFSH